MQSEAFRFDKSFAHSPKPPTPQFYKLSNDSNGKECHILQKSKMNFLKSILIQFHVFCHMALPYGMSYGKDIWQGHLAKPYAVAIVCDWRGKLFQENWPWNDFFRETIKKNRRAGNKHIWVWGGRPKWPNHFLKHLLVLPQFRLAIFSENWLKSNDSNTVRCRIWFPDWWKCL